MVSESGDVLRSEEEAALQKMIANKKQQFQFDCNELKDLKSEIEQIQNLLERSRVQMQKDFEGWLSLTIAKAKAQ